MITGLAIGIGVTVVAVVWLTKTIYQCPECHYSNDWDHVTSVTAEAPYCPYCGEHTEVDGTKFERLGRRLRFSKGEEDV
ncbi:hypothetical protein OB920_13175 [Halobacteria archaeon HArc-gm2]|nr:hypothetical protein [Halobacteria archaeon HArc-gm2]